MPSIKLKPINNIVSTDYEILVNEKDIQKRLEEIAKNHNNFKDKMVTSFEEQRLKIHYNE